MVRDTDVESSLSTHIQEVLTHRSSDLAVVKKNRFAEKDTFIYKYAWEGQAYILKETPPYCSDEKGLAAIARLRTHVRQGGIPIPELVLSQGVKVRGNRYLVETFIQGDPWSACEEKTKQMAHVLGRFHTFLHMAGKSAQDEFEKGLKKQSLFDLARLMVTIVPDRIDQTVWSCNQKTLAPLLATWKERLDTLESTALKNGYNDIRIAIHGDYNPTNVLFDAQKNVVGVIDFDDCCLDNPIHDVGTALLHMHCFTFNPSAPFLAEDSDAEQQAKRHAQLFLENYVSTSFVKREEIRPYVKEVVETVAIQLAALYLIKGVYTDFSNLTSLVDHVGRATAIVNEVCDSFTKI
ncbi:phosphotransferase enzyme family protein [Candidatus Hepatobacter penaei]|uniref:phosphotransferase enzyme family protein n=1 Tax=Candidatus Hepatobacter penaei TaxID=1274402 RepID=UPI0014411293|nr:aminoglycoside phosphotransferase family protein [Candidatus Hepatobacter penaei]